MKKLRLFAIPLLFAPLAQPASPIKWLWGFSATALASGASMDIASSYGQVEMNPALRSSDGRFGRRGAAIRIGVIGGGLLTQWLIIRKHPHAAVPLAGINIGVGALLGGVAVRNWEVTSAGDR